MPTKEPPILGIFTPQWSCDDTIFAAAGAVAVVMASTLLSMVLATGLLEDYSETTADRYLVWLIGALFVILIGGAIVTLRLAFRWRQRVACQAEENWRQRELDPYHAEVMAAITWLVGPGGTHTYTVTYAATSAAFGEITGLVQFPDCFAVRRGRQWCIVPGYTIKLIGRPDRGLAIFNWLLGQSRLDW